MFVLLRFCCCSRRAGGGDVTGGLVPRPEASLSLLAGDLVAPGAVDATGPAARFNRPTGVAIDASANLYIAEPYNNSIRKVTSAGSVTTFAGTAGQSGSTDGTGTAARFSFPRGIAVDGAGNLYVTDSRNHTLRRITSAGVVTTLVGVAGQSGSTDGSGSLARFNSPDGITIDGAGTLYVADSGNHTIRKITPAGAVTTLAGTPGQSGSTDGTGAVARFYSPQALATDGSGNVFVGDRINRTIRRITPDGVVTTVAGSPGVSGSVDGTGSVARFTEVAGLAVDSAGNIYASDWTNSTIRRITPSGVVTTRAGSALSFGSTDGTGVAALFRGPSGITIDGAGNAYVGDEGNNVIRKITSADVVTTLAGTAPRPGSSDGTGSVATFFGFQGFATGMAADGSGNLYVADNGNHVIRKITPAGVVTTFAGKAGEAGNIDGTGASARFKWPSGVAVDTSGNVYVSDQGLEPGLNTGINPVFVGGFLAAANNRLIRKITPAGVVTTLAGGAPTSTSIGVDGIGSAASFGTPVGITNDAAANVYVVDSGSHTIRKVTPAGVVTTLAGTAGQSGSTDGTGAAARFNSPNGIAADGEGNLYVADNQSHVIRKITPAGIVTTLAGTAGTSGSSDGTGASARFFNPSWITTDSTGNIYVADRGNRLIRKITSAGAVSTVVGGAGQTYRDTVLGELPGYISQPEGIARFGTLLYIVLANGVVAVKNVP